MGCGDNPTNMIHLPGFKHKLNADKTANASLKEIYRIHGFPKIVISDGGTKFTSQVWKELLKFFGDRDEQGFRKPLRNCRPSRKK